MEATVSLEGILQMLSSLSTDNKKWIADHLNKEIKAVKPKLHRRYDLTDEELAAELAQYPDWNDTEHADLSGIDYSQYKPYQSKTIQETLSKWL